MSGLARRFATFLPQEVASSRRSSGGALHIPSSFLHPDAATSPSGVHYASTLQHALSQQQNDTSPDVRVSPASSPRVCESSTNSSLSPHPQTCLTPSPQDTSTPSPLLQPPYLRRGRRASLGPSDLQAERSSLQYLGRRRGSVDLAWLCPTSNTRDDPDRPRVWVPVQPGSPILAFMSPSSLYCPARPSKTPACPTPSPGPESHGDEGVGVLQAPWSYSVHHLREDTPAASHLLRRRSCCPVFLSPSVEVLSSSKVVEGCARPSPSVSLCPSLSPCVEHTPTRSHFSFTLPDGRGVDDAGTEERGSGRNKRAGSKDSSGSWPKIPRIVLDVDEDCPTVSHVESPTLLPSPVGSECSTEARRRLLGSLQRNGLNAYGDSCGSVDLREDLTPPCTTPRRASWHHIFPSGATECDYPPSVTGLTKGPASVSSSRLCPVSSYVSHSAGKELGSSCRCLRPRNNSSSSSITTCPTVAHCYGTDAGDLKSPAVGRVIGRGGFGTVKVGCYRGVKLAVKELRWSRAAASSRREAHALCLPPHAHLAATHALVAPTNTPGQACVSWSATHSQQEQIMSCAAVASMFSLPVEDAASAHPDERERGGSEARSEWAWVVMELCTPFTLLTLINDPSLDLTTTSKIRYSRELANGLAFLHSHNLIHLDVKPANALLSSQGHLKLADFGCCIGLEEENEQVVGTVCYQSPEVLRGESGTTCSDVFSLGVTIWHLLTRTHPYYGLHPHVVLYQVARLKQRPTDYYHHHHDLPLTTREAMLRRLAETCWVEDPKGRPSASALCRSLTIVHLCSSSSERRSSISSSG